ncbi:MAG TPA: ribonuclease Z [Flavobacteriaceae bacterium]|nr:ribonuclease Z [Flavobacteriaceae bacterium]MAY51726.1 ribonuclease Z [Flavobacteriaceae bacterium]HBR55670.1 ribonuclease Z [Flavobacteriaceae bacterium]|tara:strand:- start:289 stop:624 length:336 start_codon:yes stop_codon:yes gene_type:complete
MKIENKDNYVILADEKDDIPDFASFLEYQIPNKFKGQNVVLNLLDYGTLTLQELLLFLKVSNLHRKTKQSFVFVNDAINPDDIPYEMVVVPTLQEAEDIIGMEEIERDLGF